MEARFSIPLKTSPKAYPVPCTMGTGSSLGIKQLKRDDNQPPPFSTGVANLNKPPPPLCACTCMSGSYLFIILILSWFTQWICWPCVGIYFMLFLKQWIYALYNWLPSYRERVRNRTDFYRGINKFKNAYQAGEKI